MGVCSAQLEVYSEGHARSGMFKPGDTLLFSFDIGGKKVLRSIKIDKHTPQTKIRACAAMLLGSELDWNDVATSEQPDIAMEARIATAHIHPEIARLNKFTNGLDDDTPARERVANRKKLEVAKKAWYEYSVTYTPARRDDASLCQKIVEARRSRELEEVDRRYIKRARKTADAVEQGRNALVNPDEERDQDDAESESEPEFDIVPFVDSE